MAWFNNRRNGQRKVKKALKANVKSASVQSQPQHIEEPSSQTNLGMQCLDYFRVSLLYSSIYLNGPNKILIWGDRLSDSWFSELPDQLVH